jgi:hypothetical protein
MTVEIESKRAAEADALTVQALCCKPYQSKSREKYGDQKLRRV